ncbi:nuclease [Metarhizobium album]|uniref:Nuclease n=1 Tax=Metarhizobium album TaxID=2182425 RepID=A0A2U2DTV1_9HYPH|nr:nuclease [Rhizobium album]
MTSIATTLLLCTSLVAVDGDTARCKPSGQLLRLLGEGVAGEYGVDAPEIGSHAKCDKERKLALLAKRRLKELLSRPGIRVSWDGAVDATPKHRPLVNIYLPSGEEIGKKLLREGFAREWRKGKKVDWCNE